MILSQPEKIFDVSQVCVKITELVVFEALVII